jgi:hypothetical protein
MRLAFAAGYSIGPRRSARVTVSDDPTTKRRDHAAQQKFEWRQQFATRRRFAVVVRRFPKPRRRKLALRRPFEQSRRRAQQLESRQRQPKQRRPLQPRPLEPRLT